MSLKKGQKKEVDLRLEVLSVILSRPEWAGVELSNTWLAEYLDISHQSVSASIRDAIVKLKDGMGDPLREYYEC